MKKCQWLGLVGVVGAMIIGCAPTTLLEVPVEWPNEWRGRQLYNTPNAYIYAGSESAAGEADRLVIAVAGDFQRETEREASKGLVIITDINDELIISDFKEFFKLAEKSKAIHENKPEPSDQELEERWQDTIEDTISKVGISVDTMLRMGSIQLNPDILTNVLQFQEDVAQSVQWGVAVPTLNIIRINIREMIPRILKKQGIGPLAQLAFAPILAGMEPRMVDMMACIRNYLIFEQLAGQQPDWSKEDAARITKAYKDGTIKQAKKEIEAEAKKKMPIPQKDVAGPVSEKEDSDTENG
ncbi:MAG: hypothetical protein JSV03_14490 [Planctomycetota bacterium]|nr:MAG: hypothetical protein JSV03_14490 [Planctomycetota bacterium]